MEHAILNETIDGQRVDFYPETGFEDVLDLDNNKKTLKTTLNEIKSSYLPLSGGAMTGNVIRRNVNNSNLRVTGGTDAYSANVLLFGNESASEAGNFHIIARTDANTVADLCGRPNGTLTWNGNNVLTSAGGTLTGNITRSTESTAMCIAGGTSVTQGAAGGKLFLYGGEYSATANRGIFTIESANGTQTKQLIGKPDGTLTWAGKEIKSMAFPSSTSINVGTVASGETYTAPANGYLKLICTGGSGYMQMNVTCANECAINIARTHYLTVPVKKGDKAYIYYSDSLIFNYLFFFYAQGEV